MIRLTKQADALFVSLTGKAFAFQNSILFNDGNVFFSDNGTIFHALEEIEVIKAVPLPGDRFSESQVSFGSSLQETATTLAYNSKLGIIFYDGEFYYKQIGDMFPIEIVWPEKRTSVYLFSKGNGQLIYVSMAERFSYDSFKLFVGDGKEMREIPVTRVRRMRDGGTTTITTDEGRLFRPQQMSPKPDLFPKWNEEKLIELGPKDCDIVETPDGQVTITVH